MKKSSLFHVYYIIAVCIINLLAACTQEEYTQSTYDNDQLPLEIFPTVGEAFTRTTVIDGNYQFTNQDAIGLFAVKSGDTPDASDKVYNQKYVYNGSVWNAQAGKVYWPVGELGTACVLYGYYPYTQTVSNPQQHTFTVTADQSTVGRMNANDFLYTKKPVNKENTAVILNMSHLFSMVTVNIKYEDVGNICSDISLKAKQTTTINLLKGESVASGNAVAITPVALEKASDGYSKSYSAIIPPQKVDNNSAFLSLRVGDAPKTISINRNFTAGKHYSVNLTVTKEKNIELQGIYVSQWDEQITITNGSKNETVIYNTGDVIEYQKKRNSTPVTIIVTGDGFIKEHMLKGGMFEQYATEAIEFLFDVEPFKTYRDYFNVYFIPAISEKTQIGTLNENYDTYFRTYIDTSTDRIKSLDSSKLFKFVETYCPDIIGHKTTIQNVVTIVLVNDKRYDGITWSYSDGKNYALCALPEGIMDMGGPNADKAGISVGDWRNIVLHEVGGHAFGRLADEYWYEESTRVVVTGGLRDEQNWPVPMSRNVAADISESSNTCYWHHLVGDSRFPKVGYFEGGLLHKTGIWRCEEASCMIDNRRYFNAYSRQLIVERIMKISGQLFNFDNFIAKDVNYDEILDNKAGGANTRLLKGSFSSSELRKCRPLSPPRLVDVR